MSTRFKVFVAQQIQDLSKVSAWNYVSTDKNPADYAFRGLSKRDTSKIKFWLNGPSFLKEEAKFQILFEEPTSESSELKVLQVCTDEAVVDLDVFICHFSSINHL